MKPYFILCLLLVTMFPVWGQESGVPLSPRAPLQQLAASFQSGYELRFKSAELLARQKNWPLVQTLPGGGVIRLERIDKLGLPVYTITHNNIRSAATTGTDLLWPGGSSGLQLRGASPQLLSRFALWDGGAVLASHQEFGGRIVPKDRALLPNTHATHVAGTLMAAGINRPSRGMAYGVNELLTYDFLNDNAEMAEAAATLLISNHSYGALAGWRHNEGQDRWEWYGEIDAVKDYKFGYYDLTAKEWDQIAWNAPHYLIVKSAGNNRNVNGPPPGTAYYRYNTEGIMAPAPEDAPFPEANNAYDILPLYANAKNILLVGAVNPIPDGYQEPADVVMSSFSCWGPTDDGRIKPDIMGNGVGVLSTSSDGNDAYTLLSGTSMASPNVAGSLLLLQELYSNLNNQEFMRSASLRGLVIHTASEAGPAPGPDYRFGWGLLNAAKAAEFIQNASGNHVLTEQSLTQGTEKTWEVIATGYTPLEITLCWTDPEADTISEEQALDNPAPRLVNDLDVRVTASGNPTVHFPWILDPTQPDLPAARGDNVLDNVEKVVIPTPEHGRKYTVTVSHKGTLERGPQPYSLLISGVGGNDYCNSRATESAGTMIASLTAGNLNYTAGETCTRYTNLLGERIKVRPGDAVPFSVQTGSCTHDGAHIIKLFADWNNDGDFTDESELLAESAVMDAGGPFNGTIQVPASLPAGSFIRLRFVVVNTSSSDQVQPCGAYARGETLETTLETIRPARDLSVEAYSATGSTLCPGNRNLVSVLLRNRGTEALENFPLTAEIRENSSSVTNLEGLFQGILQPGDTAVFTFPKYFTVRPSRTYHFTLRADANGDQVPANNVHEIQLQSTEPGASPPGLQALVCEAGQEAILRSYGSDWVYWYDQLQGGNLIGVGDSLSTTFTGNTWTVYAASHDFKGRLGPATKYALPPVTDGDAYHQYTPSVRIKTQVPLTIESARMYTGHAGKIAFTVYDSRGVEISRSIQHVSASRHDYAPGPLPDDPLDTGRTYFLNLTIPRPGDYLITLDYEGTDATIFRNTTGPGYPVEIPGIVSITGTTASPAAAGSYYYFYDMRVRAAGCASPRIAVQGTELTAPQIMQTGDTLFVNGPGGQLQWYLNEELIAGAVSPRLHAAVSGTYRVSTALGNCVLFSEPVVFKTLEDLLAELENNGLKVYPNPGTAGRDQPVQIEYFARAQDEVELTLVDMQGKVLHRETPSSHAGKNIVSLVLQSLPPGIYGLNVRINGKSFGSKYIIHR